MSRPKTRPTIVALALMLLTLTIGTTMAQTSVRSTTLLPGETLAVAAPNCPGLQVITTAANAITISCAGGGTSPTATATRTPTRTPAPTQTPVPTQPPAPTAIGSTPPIPSGEIRQGLWTSAAELAALPMSGPSWDRLKAAADGSLGSPALANLDSRHDTRTLAVGIVYARTGEERYRAKAADAIASIYGTEQGSRALEVSRNIQAYVLTADLIGLKDYRPDADTKFRQYLQQLRTTTFDGRTIASTQEDRPNNWGLHAGAARMAIARYLGDMPELDRAAQVLQGWLGDRTKYAGFKYGGLEWQADASKPVGINPPDSARGDYNIDGVMPDDQRRGGGFSWPPPCEGYVPEAFQGLVVQAELLQRAGYQPYTWSDQAIKRAALWYTDVAKCHYEGDDTWLPWILNTRYDLGIATEPANEGKNMGWTDYVYGARPR